MNVPNIKPMESQTPVTPTVPQMPMAPMAPGQSTPMGGAPMEGQQALMLSQEQMKTNLQDLMAKIENKYQDFNSQKFASDNVLMEQQGGVLRQLFDLFESMGVDPSNIEEVRALLDKIKAINPEMSQQLETALNSVLGDDVSVPVKGEVDVSGQELPVNNMNMNNEIPQEKL